MKDKILIESIIETIPQWYIAEYGPNNYTLSVGEESITFCSHKKLTPQLVNLLFYSRDNIEGWYSKLPSDPTPTSIARSFFCHMAGGAPVIFCKKIICLVKLSL